LQLVAGYLSLQVLLQPFEWIVFDVLPYFVIILLITDYMVVISSLPYVFAVLFIAKPFQCTNELRNYGVALLTSRRDSRPRLSVNRDQ